jgi:hypothetical protein
VASSQDRGNVAIAAKLRDYADMLDQQGADGFRAKAYRRAGEVVSALERSVADILIQEGRNGLDALPTIGKGISAAIAEMVATGRWSQLERLRGEMAPETLFQTIPGIGPNLARRLADDAQLETLEELENALLRGGINVKGFGERRRKMIESALSERLGRPVFARRMQPASLPPVALLLQVDQMYRERAAAGQLRKIAPRRFNPSGEAWLPIMHARHDNWHFTALYSNTRLANELGKTGDWVVIYFQAEGQLEGRCTMVTETRGAMAGKRVVRGREDEHESEAEPK